MLPKLLEGEEIDGICTRIGERVQMTKTPRMFRKLPLLHPQNPVHRDNGPQKSQFSRLSPIVQVAACSTRYATKRAYGDTSNECHIAVHSNIEYNCCVIHYSINIQVFPHLKTMKSNAEDAVIPRSGRLTVLGRICAAPHDMPCGNTTSATSYRNSVEHHLEQSDSSS